MAKPKRPQPGQHGTHRSQGAARAGAQQLRAVQNAPATRTTQKTQTVQSGQNGPATQTTATAKPATSAAVAPKATGGAPNRYRPLAAREPSARGAAKRRQAQQPWYQKYKLPIGAAISVLLLVGIFVLIAHNASSGTPAGIGSPVPDTVMKALTPADASVFSKVGAGGVPNPFKHGGGDILKGSDGKPEFFYAGAEYCPYCAAERWSIVMALSRFGTFSGLKQTASGDAPEAYPDTPTVTFVGATYTSKYIDFSSVEMQGRGGQSDTLQTPTAQQKDLLAKYDATPYVSSAGAIPFLSVGNQYVTNGAGYSPVILENETWQSIAGKLSNPNDDVTQNIVGNANHITAAICQITNQQPDTVCKAAPIPDIEKKL
jgi:hypothetical protein